MHDLEETEANRFITRLHEGNIQSDKIKQSNGQWAISVSKSDSITALKFLNDARMFKNPQGMSQQKSSLVSSKEDQKFYFERAVSKELERTLAGMPDVLDARVHLNLPASDPLFGNRIPDSKGSGSVLLVVNDSFSSNMAQVKELVSGASGIDKALISIIVSREKPPAVKSEENKSDLTVTSDKAYSDNVSRNEVYMITASAVFIIGLLVLIKSFKVFRKSQLKKEEEDLYELARNIN